MEEGGDSKNGQMRGGIGDNVCSDPIEWRRRRFELKAALLETNPQIEEETKPNPRN